MRKMIRLVALLLVLTFPISVQASSARVKRALPALSFSGKTATCSVTVLGGDATDPISVTVKLWKGSSCIATWNDSGTGSLKFSATKTVSSSGEYKLTADAIIAGTALSTVSATASCS